MYALLDHNGFIF